MIDKYLHSFQRNSYQCLYAISLCCIASESYSREATNNMEISASYIDNIGLASNESDIMSDTMIELQANRTYRETVGISQILSYGIDFSARDYQDYPCDRITFGLQASYEKKLGLGFDKPRLSVSWNGSRNIYAVDSINGYSSELSLRLSKPINERLDTAVSISKNWEIPDNSPNTIGLPASENSIASDALNQESITLQVSAEYFATEHWSFPVSLSYLDGDLASIGRLRQKYLTYADAIANDEGLGPDWFLYRSSGKAWSANLAASRLLADGSLLNLEFGYTDASTRGNIKYDRHSFSVSWIKNW